MSDQAEKTLAEKLAELEAEEKREAEAKKESLAHLRLKRAALKKECEKKYAGAEGYAFAIVEGVNVQLFVVTKPTPVMWKAFQSTDRSQPDWESLYRTCVAAEDWDRVQNDFELHPGVEDRIVRAITSMLGFNAEARAKK